MRNTTQNYFTKAGILVKRDITFEQDRDYFAGKEIVLETGEILQTILKNPDRDSDGGVKGCY